MTRCVTLEGDIVDPEGTLSGGSRPKGGAVLVEVAVVKKLFKSIENVTIQLQDINAKIAKIQKAAQTYHQIKEELDLQQHELNNVKQRLSQSSFQQHQAEITELKQKNGNFINMRIELLLT